MPRLRALALALLGLLVVAPGAQADKGVYDTFGTSGAQGGQFGNIGGGISGVAVNSTGAGAAGAGDVYVLDRGNNRIQHFDADGAFIRAFGQDVITNTGAPPNSNGTGYEICDTTTVPANTAADCKAGIA
ncbi:MAG TPA: hypothetical protein VFY04_02645, partial [Solirubrobacterales bacterium]|nr:hypothetical protein [Solirubrobacterales bacterium]